MLLSESASVDRVELITMEGNFMIKRLALVFLVFSFAACSSGARIKTYVGSPLTPVSTHLEGVKKTVYVGDTMTSSAPLIVIESLTLKTNLTATSSHRDKLITLQASPGGYTLVRQNEFGKFYESTGQAIVLNGEPIAGGGGLFLTNEGVGGSALYWGSLSAFQAALNQPLNMHIADLVSKPEVSISTSTQPPKIQQGFVATLVYLGMAGGQIKFVYREYTDGLARSAFTQEVSLDYVPGKTYVYKTAQLVVHEASTSEVTFTLLQSL